MFCVCLLVYTCVIEKARDWLELSLSMWLIAQWGLADGAGLIDVR